MSEYAFDVTLQASIRVEADSYEEAERLVRDTLNCASVNAGAWPNGDPVLFEASVVGEISIYELDGEPV